VVVAGGGGGVVQGGGVAVEVGVLRFGMLWCGVVCLSCVTARNKDGGRAAALINTFANPTHPMTPHTKL